MFYTKLKAPIFLMLAMGISLIVIMVNFLYANPRHSRVSALNRGARARLDAAVRDMHKHGIKPNINSAFRSHSEQTAIYRCAHNRRCRGRRGIYGANKPGTSMHEAGLAVDLSGVAAGNRHRHLTTKGRLMVRIMRQHGFKWRYGLKDPAHFELSPQQAGYNSEKAAIQAGQRRALAKTRSRARKKTNKAAA